MNETKAFYYWAIKNHQSWERQGNQYKVTQKQLQDFYNLCIELLKNKDIKEVEKKLPPYPQVETITDEYWKDLDITKDEVGKIIKLIDNETDTGNYYYYGTIT